MKREWVFVCSPYRGNTEENVEQAKGFCKALARYGYNPIAPHVYYTQFLDDGIEYERQLGIELGMMLLTKCSQVFVYGEPTEGMKQEIQLARVLGIPVEVKSCE